MIRIAISLAAFEALATFPFGTVAYELEPNANGERLIWLEDVGSRGWGARCVSTRTDPVPMPSADLDLVTRPLHCRAAFQAIVARGRLHMAVR
jgi:hypothetical protein